MSDSIKHECGIALVRLLKPQSYYIEKYGTATFGLDTLYLLMEKQHNRGQEGAGAACVRIDACPGEEYIFRERAEGSGAINDVFQSIGKEINEYRKHEPDGQRPPFVGDLYLGHLRYSTTGRSGLSYVHPFLRRNNWRSRNLCVAGNFNLTNIDEIISDLVATGQHPRHNADTFVLLEQLGYLLDKEVEKIHANNPHLSPEALSDTVEEQLDIESILKNASRNWDGGFVMCGLIGNGDAFVYRDKWGIRPAFYFRNDEVIVVASERPVIQTIMNVPTEEVHELTAGHALIIKRDGHATITPIYTDAAVTPCSFERIYFSRGSDKDIYKERKELGARVLPQILESIDKDIDHAVFSYIPNTAEVAYYGMIEAFEKELQAMQRQAILDNASALTEEMVNTILSTRVRTEKLAIKDIKLRTFIAENNSRNDLMTHVYDITYGAIRENEDAIVVIDDSIVRGTTLKKSIIKILSRLNAKKIVVVSSSPQIRYPDCYGIDMSKMEEFIAFNAAIELLLERGMSDHIHSVYQKCKAQQGKPKEAIINYVKAIYEPFSDNEISAKIAQMVTPAGVGMPVEIVFQTIDNLRAACPCNNGDWYFSGNYPTPGGNRIVNTAFINYYERIYCNR
ncbi:MAG: amidophosphoribosyltransferase [Marinifilaceae bacterium]